MYCNIVYFSIIVIREEITNLPLKVIGVESVNDLVWVVLIAVDRVLILDDDPPPDDEGDVLAAVAEDLHGRGVVHVLQAVAVGGHHAVVHPESQLRSVMSFRHWDLHNC